MIIVAGCVSTTAMHIQQQAKSMLTMTLFLPIVVAVVVVVYQQKDITAPTSRTKWNKLSR